MLSFGGAVRMFGKRKIDLPASADGQPAPPPAPEPVRRPRIRRPRGGLMSMLSGLTTFGVLLAGVGVFGVLALEGQVDKPGPLSIDKIVLIPKSVGTAEIADLLAREGVVENPTLFELYAYLSRRKGQLKAGEFTFPAGISIEGAIDTLIFGKAILHTFTLPEGLTSEQIVGRIRENDILTGAINEIPREGSLMPDTYKFERGMTRQQLVNLMQAMARDALNKTWASRAPDLSIRTPQELVILASIVEKETGRADERQRVASVFVNRLNRRMKLQSDPTIVYGIVGGKGTLGRPITRADIDRPTPYNTYTIEGLPPGPIANPGRASLAAAANPLKTRDIFFVADGTGGHAFAETLDQHNRNVARWRQIERERGSAESAADRPQTPPNTRTNFEAAPDPVRTATASFDVDRTAATSRGFDASEGTALDPLKNRSWDLTSPKAVPSFGLDPEPAPVAARPGATTGRPGQARGAAPAAGARNAGARREAEALPPGVDPRRLP